MRTKMLLNGKCAIIYFVLMFYSANFAECHRCSRVPEGFGTKRSPSSGMFRIRLSELSGQYTPGKQYTIWLEKNDNSIKYRDRKRHTFTGFYLAVDQKANLSNPQTEEFYSASHGTFETIEGDSLTKLECGNLVTHSTNRPKSEIQVHWTAPEKGVGCVVFRATVIEHRDIWYMDDGPLTKEFCENDQEGDTDNDSSALEECCACNEAKYEVTFEGLWSRNTHPNEFPSNPYTTRFSDIIGATHKYGYWFWRNGDFASEGVKEVAEMGATKKLESELKDKSERIRTIIKARGLSYPNITGKTFAVFRVDSTHHLVSLVSMLSPSPDWFVGVSELELCKTDCTWVEHKVVELYPWDAGTDSGTSYNSPDQETRPQEHIRRITFDSPRNNLSPFYDPQGLKMKPLARLTLLRQRLYEKNCTNALGTQPDCEMTEYLDWGECQPKCGRGKRYRHRYYKKEGVQKLCGKTQSESEYCYTECDESENTTIMNDPDCPLSDFGEWNECSKKCGEGIQSRYKLFTKNLKRCQRRYLNMKDSMKNTRTCFIRHCIGDGGNTRP